MVWLRSPATAELTPAKDKTNDTNISNPACCKNNVAEFGVGVDDPDLSF